jgi:hypothetical protein
MSNEYDGITYYCTGSGTHDPARPDRVALAYPVVPGITHAGRRRGGRLGLELICPVCGRAARYPRKAGTRLAEAGITRWDISRPLPF